MKTTLGHTNLIVRLTDFPHAQNPKSKYIFYSARMGFGGRIKNFFFLYAVKLHFIFTNANLSWQKPQTQTF
jgi:hypothetical protein